MTWGKIALVLLGIGGGSYGVFRTVSSMPNGVGQVVEGVEVGQHSSELAMARKPALPDDTGPQRLVGGPVPGGSLPGETLPGANSGSTLAPSSLTSAQNSPNPPADIFASNSPTPNPSNSPAPTTPLGDLPGSQPATSVAALGTPKLPGSAPKLPGPTSPSPSIASNSQNPAASIMNAQAAPDGDTSGLGNLLRSAANANAAPPNKLPENNLAANAPSLGSQTASPGLLPGGLPKPALPSASRSLPSTGLPGTGLPSTGLPSTGLPSTGLPSTGLPSTGLPSTGLPSTGLPENDLRRPEPTTNPSALARQNDPSDLPNPAPTNQLGIITSTAELPTANPIGPRMDFGKSAAELPNSSGIASNGVLPNRSPAQSLPTPGSPAQGSSTQGSSTQGSPAQGLLAQGLANSRPAPLDAVAIDSFPNRTATQPPSAPNSSMPNVAVGNPLANTNQSNSNQPNRSDLNDRPGSHTQLASEPMLTDRNVQPATYPNYQENQTPATNRAPSSLVSNQPGDPRWEIQQTASLILEKRAPEQVQVNVPATFFMAIRNVGRSPAGQVLVRDRIPEGTRLIQATPKPDRQQGDLLEWDFASIAPGDTMQIQLQLLPISPGELGSVAEVSMAAVAGCRTRCTKPQLVIQHTAPPQVMIGQQVVMNITVRNEGDGPAENVVIRETVPAGLSHPSGTEIENPVGQLLPGQSRTIQLPLVAMTAGNVTNTVRVTGEGKLTDEHSINVQVVSPELQVTAAGPDRRYLSREATHTFEVKNNGTANATNVQMMAQLPRGLKYESSTPAGRYDPARHAVFWAMQQLPSNSNEQVAVTTLPLAAGEQPIEFKALADLNQPQSTIKQFIVEQLSELFFDVDDLQDPIEVNSKTSYVVRVENQGSQVANDVSLVVDLPKGIEPLNIEAPVEYQIQNIANGKRIVFAPIAQLNPKSQQAIRIEAKGVEDGDHRIEVQMTSRQRPTAVAKQESTKVYSDMIR